MQFSEFLRTIALNLLESDAYYLTSPDSKEYKLGIIYETKRMYVVPYYEVNEDTFILRIRKYNKNFEELSSKSYESEEDVGIYLSSLKGLKESELNKELIKIFDKMSTFIKHKEPKVVN